MPSLPTLAKIAGCGALLVSGAFSFTQWKIEEGLKSGAWYTESMRLLRAHRGAAGLLGEPIVDGRLDLGSNDTNFCDQTRAQFRVPVKDILVGLDCYWDLMKQGEIRLEGGPVAQETALGWIISGPKQKGYLHLWASRADGAWTVNRLELELATDASRKLLVHSNEDPPVAAQTETPSATSMVETPAGAAEPEAAS
ncbi:hypothetical protein FJT64_010822 [Amphibalanus amphitrite]|uniref:Uncharacterized protein n=1 Tax=Amphibalanus amphitrite TaxID=1232801 RepID=A0A6A4VCW8_AMPAM|nr:hypothetical protein FJT64_010822 [Amphibalanus amphitrite]